MAMKKKEINKSTLSEVTEKTDPD